MTGLKQNYDFKCLEGNEKKLFDKRGEPKHLFKFIQQYLKEDWDSPFPGTQPFYFFKCYLENHTFQVLLLITRIFSHIVIYNHVCHLNNIPNHICHTHPHLRLSILAGDSRLCSD